MAMSDKQSLDDVIQRHVAKSLKRLIPGIGRHERRYSRREFGRAIEIT